MLHPSFERTEFASGFDTPVRLRELWRILPQIRRPIRSPASATLRTKQELFLTLTGPGVSSLARHGRVSRRAMSDISRQIWDMKYRLKEPDGTPVDGDVAETWAR